MITPDWEQWRHECAASANQVIKLMRKDDIVIFLWSYWASDRAALFNLLVDTTAAAHDLSDESNCWKFYPRRVKHPISEAQILLIVMPDADGKIISEKKRRFQRILRQMEKTDIKISAHIWVHDISQSWLRGDGKPHGWDSLREISGLEMEKVTFLAIKWEKASSTHGQIQEKKIQESLREDMKNGLVFKRLPKMDKDKAWSVIDGIRVMRAPVDGKPGKLNVMVKDIIERAKKKAEEIRRKAEEARKKAEEEARKKEEEEARKKAEEEARKKAEEDSRVRFMQREIVELYAKLDKTEYGRGVRAKLRKASDDQQRIMEPLLAQMDSEGLKPKEKERLENVIKEEYDLCLREFRGYFAEVRAMRIEIGPHLREFYGLLEPKVKKRRLRLFRS